MTETVKDRRAILALIAGALGASMVTVARVAGSKAAEEDEPDFSEKYLDTARLFGKLEDEGRIWRKQLWGSNPAEGATRVSAEPHRPIANSWHGSHIRPT